MALTCVTALTCVSRMMAAEYKPSDTLPILYINVYTDESHTAYNNEIIDKDLSHKNYFSHSTYWLDLNGCDWIAAEGAVSVGSADSQLPLEIKARGNYSRTAFSKKPYKLKLGAKQSLLGLSKSKHFALLAHADDNKGYLRNFVGFNLGKRIGLPWTPRQQPVEVIINGDYRGLYFLTESIRVEKGRIEISELDDDNSDPSLCSGGYVVELDNYDEENQIRLQEKSCVSGHNLDRLRVTWDTPESYSGLQERFVRDQFTAMNDAVGANSDILWSYLDLDDAARYYIVEEMICHYEAYHGSTYLFRDRGDNQKWHFSPLWDCGNAFNAPSNDYFYNHDPFGNTWIPSLCANSTFMDKVKSTWLWFMSNEYRGLIDDIYEYVGHISDAARSDRDRWKNSPCPVGGRGVEDNSDMTARRGEVVTHLQSKINWLSGKWGRYNGSESYPEPVRDATPAASLPSYLTSAIDEVSDIDCGYEPEYYDLTGCKVSHPVRGRIYIERRGASARVIMK